MIAILKIFLGLKYTEFNSDITDKNCMIHLCSVIYLNCDTFFNMLRSLAHPIALYIKSLKIIIFLIIFTLTFSETILANPKYSMNERFGIGLEQHISKYILGRNIDSITWQDLGVGWYFDWDNKGKSYENLDYMGLVGGWNKGAPESPSDPRCTRLTSNTNSYKNNMMWTVGNEIGWDDGRTPDDYANDFIKWKSCLKSINPTFQVGSGALVSLWHNNDSINRKETGINCVPLDDTRSGKSFFTSYINKIKLTSPESIPDFIVYHGYTYCNGAKFTKNELADSITTMRSLMKNLGLENKDLVIKEWGFHLIHNKTFEERQSYLIDTVNYLLDATDNITGNPDDDFKLVQKFAWFVSADIPSNEQFEFCGNRTCKWDRSTALFDTFTNELTPLGDAYKQIIISRTNRVMVSDDRFGISGSTSGLNKLGLNHYRSWDPVSPQKLIDQGYKSYFTVGKIDDCNYINRGNYPEAYPEGCKPGTNPLMTWANWNGHPKCLRSENDRTVTNCIEVSQNGIPNDNGFDMIQEMATKYKGQIWEITNEPDWMPYILPEDYAVWFYLFQKEIRRVDPTAKIMIGGLHGSVLDEPYGYFKANRKEIDPIWANANDKYNWIKRFREKHKDLYGDYPRITIWNIHPYVYNINDQNLSDGTLLTRFKNPIITFRNMLENLTESESISEKNKPIYITELGSLELEGSTGGSCEIREHGCLTYQEQEKEWQRVTDFTTQSISWLANNSSNYAQRWYWFYYGQTYSWNNGFNFLSTTAPLNSYKQERFKLMPDVDPIGVTYSQLAKSSQIFNTSFESYNQNNEPFYWIFWDGSTNSSEYTMSTDTNNFGTGTRSVKIHVGEITGPYGNIAGIRQIIPSTYYTGKIIKLSAWCKTTETGKAYLKISLTDTTGFRNSYWQPSITAPESCIEGKTISTPYVLIPENTKIIEFEGMAQGKNSDIWFDNFKIEVNDFLFGDINQDKRVDLSDAFRIIYALNNTTLISEIDKIRMDTNNDSKITLQDVIILLTYIFS